MSLLVKSGIYKIVNTLNNKFYVGSSVSLKKRHNDHFNSLASNKHKNKHLQHAYNKYGKQHFKFEIIELVIDLNNLISREQFYIDTLKPHYNICIIANSSLGVKRTKAFKDKVSKSHIGLKPSIETRLKMSKSQKGRTFTDEQLAKMKGRKVSEAVKNKMSLAQKDRTFSLEHRQKLSDAAKKRIRGPC